MSMTTPEIEDLALPGGHPTPEQLEAWFDVLGESRKARRRLRLVYVEGLPEAVAAEQLGVTEAAVRETVRRFLAKAAARAPRIQPREPREETWQRWELRAIRNTMPYDPPPPLPRPIRGRDPMADYILNGRGW